MGGLFSRKLHRAERELQLKDLPQHQLLPQAVDVLADLQTVNDMKGRVAVDHIFKDTREVYGQPAADMEATRIEWERQFDIHFLTRPCPYDYPAYAHEKHRALSSGSEYQ